MLEIDGLRLTQSVAICEYLDDTRPDPPLLPASPEARARCRELVEIVNSGIQPLQNKGVLDRLIEVYGDATLRAIQSGHHVGGADAADEAGAEPWPRHWIARGFIALERRLAQLAGRYCTGDVVTLADVALAPQVTGARRYGLDLDPYPTIRRIEAALLERDAFRRVLGG